MKHRHLVRALPAAFACLFLMALAPAASAQQLQAGRVIGATTSANPNVVTTFAFQAESAGVLTVVVRSIDETDLVLSVTDADGQPLPDARSGQDLGGDSGAEQLAVTLPRAGWYQVRVEPNSMGVAAFRIGASWLPFADLEFPVDPDGSPSTAIPLPPEQQTHHDSLDEVMGDYWDWFVIVPDRAGTLTVVTRMALLPGALLVAEEGDLVLQAFEEDSYAEAWESSDQDLQGVLGHEALTLSVVPGEPIYFRVWAYSSSDPINYRLLVSFIPD